MKKTYTTDEQSGTWYYVILKEGQKPPSAKQLKKGRNAGNWPAVACGMFSLDPNESGPDGDGPPSDNVLDFAREVAAEARKP